MRVKKDMAEEDMEEEPMEEEPVAEEEMMSFLHLMIPMETSDDLIAEIRKQVEDGRLEENHGKPVVDPTPELSRLVQMLQGELNERHLVPFLIEVDCGTGFVVDSIGKEGSCYILCIAKYLAGGAYWTDLVRKCEIKGNTILKCEVGFMESDVDEGGVYLVLVSALISEFNRKRKYDFPLEDGGITMDEDEGYTKLDELD